MYLSDSTVCGSTFRLLIQYLLFCFCLDLFHDETRYQQRFELIPFTQRKVTPFKFENNLKTISGSKAKKLQNIEVERQIRYSCTKVCTTL